MQAPPHGERELVVRGRWTGFESRMHLLSLGVSTPFAPDGAEPLFGWREP
jgi:hypothetical protein